MLHVQTIQRTVKRLAFLLEVVNDFTQLGVLCQLQRVLAQRLVWLVIAMICDNTQSAAGSRWS